MTTNINFYGKPFGAPLLPNKMTSDGWSIADARHIGGHRVVDTVDDLYELYDWQLVNPSALLHNDKSSAAGQKWYVKGDGTYMLKSYDNRKSASGWVKVEDIHGNTIIPLSGETVASIIQSHSTRISNVENKLGSGANKANGPIVLDTNGYIPSSASTAFKTVNGQSILKTNGGASDIAIDLSLYIIPANNTLPTTGIDTKKIYLIRNAMPNGTNKYTEYMYVNGAWETLGEYRAEISISDYLKKTDAESTYVKRSHDSPATYVLNSSDSLNASDANSIDKAASVALLYNVDSKLRKMLNDCSPVDHVHTVTINGADKKISTNKVDLGTYVTETGFTGKVQAFTYSKTEIDAKIKNVTTSSLGIATLSNTEIDTMFTQIFG
mgnify:CR=1 FL=1|jgi:hypothetical protein